MITKPIFQTYICNLMAPIIEFQFLTISLNIMRVWNVSTPSQTGYNDLKIIKLWLPGLGGTNKQLVLRHKPVRTYRPCSAITQVIVT